MFSKSLPNEAASHSSICCTKSSRGMMSLWELRAFYLEKKVGKGVIRYESESKK